MATAPQVKKDVFIVHSESDPLHAAVYDRLRTTAEQLGVLIYGYEDWAWEKDGIARYENSGTPDQLDPVLWLKRDRHPFRHETLTPDGDALFQLWADARVVLILEAEGRPSDGMLREMTFLERFYSAITPIIISVAFAKADPRYIHGLPIAFRLSTDDGLGEDELSKQILALVLIGYFVHLLRSFGPAGYFVLAKASTISSIVRDIVETSPGHRDLDFEALANESRAHTARVWEQETPTEIDVAEHLRNRIVAINNERDVEAIWNSKVTRVVSWLRNHRLEYELMDAACIVADEYELHWSNAHQRFRYALMPS